MKTRITNPKIKSLKKNEVFVFGSNNEGNHAGGAAKLATDKFGAQMGIARGITGQCYAVDTMSGIEVITEQIQPFIEAAKTFPDKVFLVTELGCGIAGYKPEQIAPLFKDAVSVENIHLPESFWTILNAPAKQEPVRGYKVFNPDFTCKEFQYEIGKEYKMEGEIKACKRGFHFCIKAAHCFSYYAFDSSNVVCEVEALGEVLTHDDDSKICTNHIRIIRQLTWDEMLKVCNDGKNNTGYSNTGDRNTGSRNTGSWNTGDRNTGSWNTGDRNTGSWNTGDRNTGSWNTGSRNTGYRNTGYRNTGSWNTGSWNTGYSNTGDRNTGAFCTGEKTMKFFNKDSDWTEQHFKESKAFQLLCEVDTKLWVPEFQMTEDEKIANKGWKTAEGFYRDIPFKQAFIDKWNNWTETSRKAFTSLPNFDANIFFEITGVKVE